VPCASTPPTALAAIFTQAHCGGDAVLVVVEGHHLCRAQSQEGQARQAGSRANVQHTLACEAWQPVLEVELGRGDYLWREPLDELEPVLAKGEGDPLSAAAIVALIDSAPLADAHDTLGLRACRGIFGIYLREQLEWCRAGQARAVD
tara:strand:- start:229 stop:669 length:441 start_codon:yes stop_codon:yes gene_type:complete